MKKNKTHITGGPESNIEFSLNLLLTKVGVIQQT